MRSITSTSTPRVSKPRNSHLNREQGNVDSPGSRYGRWIGLRAGHRHGGKLEEPLGRAERRWPHHAFRCHWIRLQVRGRSEELRAAELGREKRVEKDGAVYPDRPGRRGFRGENGTLVERNRERFGRSGRLRFVGHRRVRYHRARALETGAGRSK